MTTIHAHSDDSKVALMLDALGDRIAETAALIDAATHQLLSDLRLFDEAEGWRTDGALSAAHWLAWRTGMDLGASREKVRVARALGSLPLIDDALKQGLLSFSKARALTRVATRENEATLLELALTSTASQLETFCRAYRQAHPAASMPNAVGADAVDASAIPPRRWLRIHPCDDDGMVRLDVKLTPTEAAMVLKACKSMARANDVDDAAALCTIAEAALRGGLPTRNAVAANDNASSDCDASDCDASDCDASDCDAPVAIEASRPPVEILLRIDATTLLGQTEEGFGVSAEVSRRLLCDAGVVPVLEDAEGRVVDAGRKLRTPSASLRRALHARDGGRCTFPSCTNRITDAHHLEHWIDGGETTLDNLALTCPAHHALLHEGGLSVARRADGALAYYAPDGSEVPHTGWRVAVIGRGADLLRQRLATLGVSLDPRTWRALR